MEYFLNSKVIGTLGIFTATLIGVDRNLFSSTIMDALNINAFFTNLYMVLFAVYYILRIYWYWQDRKLDKKEREDKLKNR